MANITKDYIVVGRSDAEYALRYEIETTIIGDPAGYGDKFAKLVGENIDQIISDLVTKVFDSIASATNGAAHRVVMNWVEKERVKETR